MGGESAWHGIRKAPHHNVIRFAPPLTITRDDIDWAFDRIEKVLMPDVHPKGQSSDVSKQ